MEDSWDNSKKQVTIGNIIGGSFDDEVDNFDMTEVQELVAELQNTEVPDLTHAEYLQQRALRAADILTEYLGKIVKVLAYYEALGNRTKNLVALKYENPSGKTTQEDKKRAGESSEELMEIETKVARIKGAKAVIEKKFEIVIRMYHGNKDVALGLRKSLSFNQQG